MERLGLGHSRFKHMDITSFHTDEAYQDQEEEGVVHMTQGYSRDHRPDLNQVALNLIVENQAGLPCYMQVLDGNSSDKTAFTRLVEEHVKGLKPLAPSDILVADSAFYTRKTLETMGNTKWISRAPQTIQAASYDIYQARSEAMTKIDENYCYQSVKSDYTDIDQRWLLIESLPAKARVRKSLNNKMNKATRQELKDWEQLMNQKFACRPDAKMALDRLVKEPKFTTIESCEVIEVPCYPGRGRPSRDQKQDHYDYYLRGVMATGLAARNRKLEGEGRFIVATNELDEAALSNEELLAICKGQSVVERGFRFLKEPLFHASSFFLTSVKRIMALLMIMTLSLMVYAALEYRARQALKQHQETFPDQKGQETQNPTARWIFYAFFGIHILIVDDLKKIILNLKAYHRKLLSLLGHPYEAIYS